MNMWYKDVYLIVDMEALFVTAKDCKKSTQAPIRSCLINHDPWLNEICWIDTDMNEASVGMARELHSRWIIKWKKQSAENNMQSILTTDFFFF